MQPAGRAVDVEALTLAFDSHEVCSVKRSMRGFDVTLAKLVEVTPAKLVEQDSTLERAGAKLVDHRAKRVQVRSKSAKHRVVARAVLRRCGDPLHTCESRFTADAADRKSVV